ncbi:MAG: hypothetical protein K5634_02370 [Sphaerochaetaceae bacterium]|nr:hypothetical protein [Sphaerochaetaceae bacterium]
MGKIRLLFAVLAVFFILSPAFAYTEEYVYKDTVSFTFTEEDPVKKGEIFTDSNSNVFVVKLAEKNTALLQRLWGKGEYERGSALEKRGPLVGVNAYASLKYSSLYVSLTGPLYPFIPVLGVSYEYGKNYLNLHAGLKTSISLSLLYDTPFFLIKNGCVDIMAAAGTDTTFSSATLTTGFYYRYNLGRINISLGVNNLTTGSSVFSMTPCVGMGVSF